MRQLRVNSGLTFTSTIGRVGWLSGIPWFPQIWLTHGKNFADASDAGIDLKENFGSLQVKNGWRGIMQLKLPLMPDCQRHVCRFRIPNFLQTATLNPSVAVLLKPTLPVPATTGMTARRKLEFVIQTWTRVKGTNHSFFLPQFKCQNTHVITCLLAENFVLRIFQGLSTTFVGHCLYIVRMG